MNSDLTQSIGMKKMTQFIFLLQLMDNLCKHSYPCMALHGGIDQYDRDSTIIDFKSGNIKLLVSKKWRR